MPKNPALISVVTVVSNDKDGLARTLQSLNDQTFDDWQSIVVDGASEDNTADVAKNHLSAGSVLISEPDSGIYDAMNKGITAATGQYIQFLNAGDVYADNNTLGDVSERIHALSPDLMYGNIEMASPDGNWRRHWRTGKYTQTKLYTGWMIPHPAAFFRRTFFDSLGLFNPEFTNAGDYELILRWLTTHSLNLYYMDIVLAIMELGGTSNKSVGAVYSGMREVQRAWRLNGLPYPLGIMASLGKPLRKILQLRIETNRANNDSCH